MRRTDRPACARTTAAASPFGPAPTTTASYEESFGIGWRVCVYPPAITASWGLTRGPIPTKRGGRGNVSFRGADGIEQRKRVVLNVTPLRRSPSTKGRLARGATRNQ